VPELSVMVDAGDVTINAALELCRRNYNGYSFAPESNRGQSQSQRLGLALTSHRTTPSQTATMPAINLNRI
jgi:hypothetical protein